MRRHDEAIESEESGSTSGGTATLNDGEALAGANPCTTEASGVSASRTDRGSGQSLECYLREVSHWKLLSAEDERALARRIAKGDSAALEELVSRNLRLVVFWAKRYGASAVPIEDLVQEGNIGLMRAAEKFNHRKGTRFSTYASWWIRQALTRAICDKQDLIRIPVHMHQKMRIFERAMESTGALDSADVDIEATVEKLAIIPVDEWRRTRRLQQSVSIDRRPDQDRDGPIDVEDQKSANPVREVQLRETREHVSRLLKELPWRQRSVLKLRFGLGGGDEHTLESIGARLHISRERVRQIQAEAMKCIAERVRQLKPLPRVTKKSTHARIVRNSVAQSSRVVMSLEA